MLGLQAKTNKKMNPKVAVLLADGFEQSSVLPLIQDLERYSFRVETVSPRVRSVRAWNCHLWGDKFTVDLALRSARSSSYLGLYIPAGVLHTDQLRADEEAVNFVRGFCTEARPIAALSHGPQLLIEAQAVRGRCLTSHPAIRTDLINAGAQWVDADEVIDHQLLTARSLTSLRSFSQRFIDLLRESANNLPSKVTKTHIEKSHICLPTDTGSDSCSHSSTIDQSTGTRMFGHL